ncbi:hypothetical protein BDW67DRAFT_57599 [Aspergillus spinulosporus]
MPQHACSKKYPSVCYLHCSISCCPTALFETNLPLTSGPGLAIIRVVLPWESVCTQGKPTLGSRLVLFFLLLCYLAIPRLALFILVVVRKALNQHRHLTITY